MVCADASCAINAAPAMPSNSRRSMHPSVI
jgi:hypothetical protein